MSHFYTLYSCLYTFILRFVSYLAPYNKMFKMIDLSKIFFLEHSDKKKRQIDRET